MDPIDLGKITKKPDVGNKFKLEIIMKRPYAVGLLTGIVIGLVAVVWVIMTPTTSNAQECQAVPGRVEITRDPRNLDGRHLIVEIHPISAVQKVFTATLPSGVTTTVPVNIVQCFTTEDGCYGDFEIPTGTVSFVTGIMSVTAFTGGGLRVDGCVVKVVPTSLSWPTFRPNVGQVELLRNSLDKAGPVVRITANQDGTMSALAYDPTTGEAENVTDLLGENSRLITDSQGVYLDISFLNFLSLTETKAIGVDIDGLRYKLEGQVELQFQKGERVDLARYAGRSTGMLWLMQIFDPMACPKLVDVKVNNMTVSGRIVGIDARLEIYRTIIVWAIGVERDASEGLITHTYPSPITFAPIVIGFNQAGQKICEEVAGEITVPVIVIPTPTPIPTTRPPAYVIVTASGPLVFSLDYQLMARPKLIAVTTMTRTFLMEPTTPFSVPLGTLYINPMAPSAIVRTGFAETRGDGRLVFLDPELLMMGDIRN